MIRLIDYDWGHAGLVEGDDLWTGQSTLYDGWVSHQANSAGGVSVKFSVKNYGTKNVKKFRVYFSAYNGAGEKVSCTVRRESTRVVASTDMVRAGETKDSFVWNNTWYNNSIRSIKIDRIEVTYTDGTTESCNGNYMPTSTDQETAKKSDLTNLKIALLELVIGIGGLWLCFKVISWCLSDLFG